METILKVHKKFNDMVQQSFKANKSFVEAHDIACRRFINENAVTKIAKVARFGLICSNGLELH